jgi:hypothetical protein
MLLVATERMGAMTVRFVCSGKHPTTRHVLGCSQLSSPDSITAIWGSTAQMAAGDQVSCLLRCLCLQVLIIETFLKKIDGCAATSILTDECSAFPPVAAAAC